MKYNIYQLPNDLFLRKQAQLLLGEVKDIPFGGYQKTYSDELKVEKGYSTNQILEKIFEKLNIDHPEDYQGHSLSLTDIVEINKKYYRVAQVGFELLNIGGEV